MPSIRRRLLVAAVLALAASPLAGTPALAAVQPPSEPGLTVVTADWRSVSFELSTFDPETWTCDGPCRTVVLHASDQVMGDEGGTVREGRYFWEELSFTLGEPDEPLTVGTYIQGWGDLPAGALRISRGDLSARLTLISDHVRSPRSCWPPSSGGSPPPRRRRR